MNAAKAIPTQISRRPMISLEWSKGMPPKGSKLASCDCETEGSFRWEAGLSRSFQANLSPALWSRLDRRPCSVVLESSCSEGRADLVWASFGTSDLSAFRPVALLLQSPTCSRILALLKRESVRTEAYLLPRIGVEIKTLRGCMRQMV